MYISSSLKQVHMHVLTCADTYICRHARMHVNTHKHCDHINAQALCSTHTIPICYRIVQSFRGTKLSHLGHHVSIHGKLSRLHLNNVHECCNTLKFTENSLCSSKNHANCKSCGPQTFCTISAQSQ